MPFECKGCKREVKCIIDGYCIHCNPDLDKKQEKNNKTDEHSHTRDNPEDN